MCNWFMLAKLVYNLDNQVLFFDLQWLWELQTNKHFPGGHHQFCGLMKVLSLGGFTLNLYTRHLYHNHHYHAYIHIYIYTYIYMCVLINCMDTCKHALHCVSFRYVPFCHVTVHYINSDYITLHALVHTRIHAYVRRYVHTDRHAYIHIITLLYITIHYTALHYITLHPCKHACIHTCKHASLMHAHIHTRIHCYYFELFCSISVCNIFPCIISFDQMKEPCFCRVFFHARPVSRCRSRRLCTVWWWTVSRMAISPMIRATSPHSSSRMTLGNQLNWMGKIPVWWIWCINHVYDFDLILMYRTFSVKPFR